MNTPTKSSPELARLIAAERAASGMSAAARGRVWGGIESTVLAPPPWSGHGFRRALRHAALSRGAMVALGVAAGGVGGMQLQAHRDHSLSRPLPAPGIVLPSEPVAEPIAPPPLVAPPAPKVVKPPHIRERPSAPPVGPLNPPPFEAAAALERERNAIDTARTALARGDAAGSLRLLAKHSVDYPSGAFAEERDALRIQALLSSGANAEAREAAAEFRAKYPKSLLLPALEHSLHTAP